MSKAQRAAMIKISPLDDGMQRSSFGALARSLLIGTRHGRGKFGRGIFQPED